MFLGMALHDIVSVQHVGLQRANRWTAQKMGMSTRCPKNVNKMSEDVPKNVQRGYKHDFRTFFGQFLPIWSMLLFGDPIQCTPVTNVGASDNRISDNKLNVCKCSKFCCHGISHKKKCFSDNMPSKFPFPTSPKRKSY